MGPFAGQPGGVQGLRRSWTHQQLLSCLGEEHHPGGQDGGAEDGDLGLDEKSSSSPHLGWTR